MLVFWTPKIKGHDLRGNRPSPWVFTRMLFNFCQNVQPPSAISPNTFKYFCRTILSISIFAEHISVVLQKTSQHVFMTHILVVVQKTLQYFFKIISLYFCITPPVFLRTPFTNLSRIAFSIFAEYFCRKPSPKRKHLCSSQIT